MRRWRVQRALAGAIVIAGGAGCQVILGLGGGVSQQQACTDGVKDGDETDIDCGGGTCPACANGEDCKVGSDCKEKVCAGGVCAAPTCHDGIKDGEETDVDCGGPMCPPCHAGDTCKGASDCISDVCTAMVCILSCTANVKDGDETDVDCGGGTCPPCALEKMCKVNADCQSGVCTSGKCVDYLLWLDEAGGLGGTDQAFFGAVAVDQSGDATLAVNFDGKLTLTASGGTVYDTGDDNTQGFAFGRYDTNGHHLWDAGFVSGQVSVDQSLGPLAVDAVGDFVALGSYASSGVNFGNGVTLPSVSPAPANAFFVAFASSDVAVAAQPFLDAMHFGTGNFQGVAVAPSDDAIVVGLAGGDTYTVAGSTVGAHDFFVVDFDITTNTSRWTHTYSVSGSSSSNKFVGVATDTAGDVVAAGVHTGTIDFSSGEADAGTPAGGGFIVQYDAKGNYKWTAGFAATPDSMAVDPQGNTLLCGEFTGTVDFGAGPLTSAALAIFLAKFSPAGTALWSKAFAVAGMASTTTSLVATDTSGNVLLGVNANPNSASDSGVTLDFGHGQVSGITLLAKLDPTGSYIWSHGFGGVGSIGGIAAYDASDVLIAGAFLGPSLTISTKTVEGVGYVDLFLAKLGLPSQ
jgi:hypothetical protein